ncbi:hypothetical protein [Sinorhizobium sp. CCBAU 05631]|uniref:hypothetical protein n=1 Tax=Sinorhizobium sp. CCBAU 05631 TaxID=794846 RepID=UPI00056A3ACA|nr:hypothetical protein [Sinorhizobium sp. CCBAU 05631]
MAIKSLRILAQLDFPSKTVRLWDGSGGPFVDGDGNIWRSCVLTDSALDQIELAINAEAFTLPLTLSGIDQVVAATIWEDYQAGEIVGSRVRILIQDCDEYDQPVGTADVKFTGTIDNVLFDDAGSGDQILSTITVEVTNRFTLRTLTNGAVLSDVDQKARSALLNPSAPADRFCERLPELIDKTIRWPNW